nr:PepSY domain-containing protein [bacterium]
MHKTTNMTSRRRLGWRMGLAAAAIVLMMLGGGLTYQSYFAVDSLVAIDVNPSIELTVNRQQKVLNVSALNEDAAIVLDGMALKGTQLKVAVNAILGSMMKTGYLTNEQNALLISVENADNAKGHALQQELTASANELLNTQMLSAAVVGQTVGEDQDLRAFALQNGISLGRAKLIDQIVAADPLQTREALVSLDIQDLTLLAQAKTVHQETTGQVKDPYIGQDKAIAAALDHAGVTQDQVSALACELDYDDGMMTYEVEFWNGNCEYEYEIDATSAKVIKWDMEQKYIAKPDKDPASSPDQNVTLIGEDKAKAIAQAKAPGAAVVKCKLDEDDGRWVYEIELRQGQTEYDCKVDAVTGQIIGWEVDEEDDLPAESQPANVIGEDKAKAIAQAKA